MTTMRSHVIATAAPALLVLALSTPALAQQSASYRLTEQVFNAGGHPAPGGVLTSSSYLVRLDAVGGSVADPGLSGPNYRMSGSFVGAYPPPREVAEARFTDSGTLAWDPERSAGVYNVYRGTLSALPLSSDTSACLLPRLTSTSASDAGVPPEGEAFYYLVTVENRLAEEGPSRLDPSGVPIIPPNPCVDP